MYSLKCYFKFCILRIKRYLFDFRVFDIISKIFSDVSDTRRDIIVRSMDYHFDRSIREIFYIPCQLVASGDIIACIPKADSLDPS